MNIELVIIIIINNWNSLALTISFWIDNNATQIVIKLAPSANITNGWILSAKLWTYLHWCKQKQNAKNWVLKIVSWSHTLKYCSEKLIAGLFS